MRETPLEVRFGSRERIYRLAFAAVCLILVLFPARVIVRALANPTVRSEVKMQQEARRYDGASRAGYELGVFLGRQRLIVSGVLAGALLLIAVRLIRSKQRRLVVTDETLSLQHEGALFTERLEQIRSLHFYQPPELRGVAGIYTVILGDGRSHEWTVGKGEKNVRGLEEVLKAVTTRTGLEWTRRVEGAGRVREFNLTRSQRFMYLFHVTILALFLLVFTTMAWTMPGRLQGEAIIIIALLLPVLVARVLNRKQLLRLTDERFSMRRHIGAFDLPLSEVTRLSFFQKLRQRGLAGIYSIETESGACFRFKVHSNDSRNPELAQIVALIEQRTGRAIIGRSEEAESEEGARLRTPALIRSLKEFSSSLRKASGSKRGVAFVAWCVRNCLSVRGELAGVSGASFRWGVFFFTFTLIALIALVMQMDVFLAPAAFEEGRKRGLDLTAARESRSVIPPAASREVTGGETASSDARTFQFSQADIDRFEVTSVVLAAFAWCSLCFGVNVLLVLLRTQARAQETNQAELLAAKQVQRTLLPSRPPGVPGFDIAASCIPALDVGGDFFDFLTVRERGVTVAIGDVSGKGLPAALLMALTKGGLSALLERGDSLVDALTGVNRSVRQSSGRGSFVSVAVARLDGESKKTTIARAGHNPPLLICGGSNELKWLSPSGIALGVSPEGTFRRTFSEETVSFGPGDLLILYTDGVTEAMDEGSEEYGETRLGKVVLDHRSATAEGIRAAIVNDVTTFRGAAPVHDDITVAVVKAT